MTPPTSSAAVDAVGLGKRYRIGAARPGGRNFREVIADAAMAPVRRLQRLRETRGASEGDAPNTVWALRDVSFALAEGDVLGILVRNGAGKSTLLKILSRITDPTAGHAVVRGRVGSLLEVGTGFHPELTGRDNVFLNGSILGMDRGYIRRRFDEIAAFAGIDSYLDTPVKHYSSGMTVRLAFAVAAHLEPDVLVVDEVLAVGDAEFQQKCLGRMDDVAREGRTVLFVSHNLGAIQRLCGRSILLDGGRLVADGDTSTVVRQYLASGGSDAPAAQWIEIATPPRADARVRLTAVRFRSPSPDLAHRPYPGGALELAVRLHADVAVPRANIGFSIGDHYGSTLLSGSTSANGMRVALPVGTSSWTVTIPSLPLRPGSYRLGLWVGDTVQLMDQLQSPLRLQVFDHQQHGSRTRYDSRHDGFVYCEYRFEADPHDGDSSALRVERADQMLGDLAHRVRAVPAVADSS